MRGFRKILTGVVTTLVVVGFSLSGYAGEEDIKEIKKQIEVLTEEMEKLKLGAVAEPKYESFMGLGPAASKIYSMEKGLSIGGYGEVRYSNYTDSTKTDIADVSRFVLYTGYKFNDWIIMNTELEFEHAGFEAGGTTTDPEVVPEVFVEFTYLDFLLNPAFNLRPGLVLIPIGFLNEYHEPTVFHGVLRPDIEANIIPTTWREIGLMAHGQIGPLKYNAALVNGLTGTPAGKNFIRELRQKGSKVNADAFATVVRINYEPVTGLLLGGTYYAGELDSDAGDAENKSGTSGMEGDVTLWEVHAQYRLAGLQLRGLFTSGEMDGNAALKATKVGKEVEGWYLEAAYDIMPLIKSDSEMAITPFVRYEDYNTHKEVFEGQTSDKTFDRTVTTIGLGFKPYPNVIVKADYQEKDTSSDLPSGKGTGKDENKIDQFNIGIGFIF
ncbi:MAG: porin [Deltaproteobacteria bacterium]|nr:porin [Deltaproteobacteria bacterium]